MEQKWQPHEAARVKAGKFRGMVGTVVGTDDETGEIVVSIQGTQRGKDVNATVQTKPENLERPR